MMPLTMAKKGEPNKIIKIGGKDETRRFLESLGFVRRRRGNSCVGYWWKYDLEC